MNQKISVIFTLLIALALLYSYSSNPLNGRTGPPCDFNICANCHTGGGALDGELIVAGIPDTIHPNTSYDVEITLTNPNLMAGRGGFQMTSIDGSNSGIGEFATDHPNATVQPGGTKQYFEHNVALNFPGIEDNFITYTGSWTAPEGPIGEIITFCVAGNIANGNGNSSGDRILQTSFSVNLEEVVLANDETKIENPVVYPNPFSQHIFIDRHDKLLNLDHIILYNLAGELIVMKQISVNDPLPYTINTDDLPKGQYLLQCRSGSELFNKIMIKI